MLTPLEKKSITRSLLNLLQMSYMIEAFI